MENSKIEWTHHTANLWWGCTKVHEGCDHCYAETLAKRTGNDVWGNDKPRKAGKTVWSDLLRYQAQAHALRAVRRVFVGSMMDIFEKSMPLTDWQGNPLPINTGHLRDRFFNEIIPACPEIQFLLLTKRPSNINKQVPAAWKINPPPNVMFGTSPVNQATFDTLTRQLKEIEIDGLRFLSIEPQLGPIAPTWQQLDGIDWIIQGGESGHNRRPFRLEWARSMRDTAADYNIPYFFKQIDKIQPIPPDLQIRQFPEEKLEYQMSLF